MSLHSFYHDSWHILCTARHFTKMSQPFRNETWYHSTFNDSLSNNIQAPVTMLHSVISDETTPSSGLTNDHTCLSGVSPLYPGVAQSSCYADISFTLLSTIHWDSLSLLPPLVAHWTVMLAHQLIWDDLITEAELCNSTVSPLFQLCRFNINNGTRLEETFVD